MSQATAPTDGTITLLLEQFIETSKRCLYLHSYATELQDKGDDLWDCLQQLCRNVFNPISRGLASKVSLIQQLRLDYFGQLFGVEPTDKDRHKMLAERIARLEIFVQGKVEVGEAFAEQELLPFIVKQNCAAFSPILVGCIAMIRCL